MARTTINSLGVPAGTIVAADLSYPLTTFSSTGIDDNADATAITIDSSENVGIGTTSTTALRLAVVTPTANHVATQIENSNTADSFGLIVKAGNDANDYTADFRKRDNSNILRIRGDGKIGLGTTSPAALLHINGSGDAIRVTSTNSGVGGAQIDLLHFTASPADGDDHASINFGGYYSGSTSSYGSAIRSNWTDVSGRESNLKFFVRNGGTFYNHMQLNHFGHLLVGREDNSNHSSRVKIVNGGGSGYESSLDFCYESKDTVRARLNTDSSGGAIEFHTFDSDGLQERARLTSDGTVLIGKTSLDNTNTGFRFEPGESAYASFVNTSATGSHRNIYCNRQSSNGTVIEFARSNSAVGTISVTSSTTSYNSPSDYRLKENIADLDNAIDRVKQIPVYRFNFIAEPDVTVDGFLAHEVSDIVPEAITGTKDAVDDDQNPKYQVIDQSKLVPLLTAAIKQQQTIIEDLQTRLAALETK